MKFRNRLFYYGVGLIIGIFVVVFFFGKKNISFDYGPNARVLKNIRSKDNLYTLEAIKTIQNKNIDTASISKILLKGNVIFKESNIKVDSCKLYTIEGRGELKNITLKIKNCESTAIIDQVIIK